MNDDIGEITLCYTVTFERRSKHSAKRLWRAITEPAEIAKWMDYPARVQLHRGGDYFVDFSRTNDGALDGIIIRVEPERVLTYAWGLSVVEWTLEDIPGAGCKYRMVHHGQDDRGEGEEGLPAGWHEFLDRFDLHLDGRYVTPAEQKANWERLKGPYLARLNDVLAPRRTRH